MSFLFVTVVNLIMCILLVLDFQIVIYVTCTSGYGNDSIYKEHARLVIEMY